jgi:hypothetical protein
MRLLLLGCALAAAAALTQPASAAGFGVGVSGGITVDPTMGACASLTFGRPVTGAGFFGSAGALSGPGTIVGAVRGALPVTLVSQTGWSGCLPDAYAGATAGYAAYTLTVSTTDGDYAETRHCVVTNGRLTCA